MLNRHIGMGKTAAADDRQHQIDRAVKTATVARLLATGAQLITIPVVLSALGLSDFGVWAAITSTLGMLMFLDFGIGNGAMNRITEDLARGDPEAVCSWIFHAYLLLGGSAVGLLVLVGGVHFSGAFQAGLASSGSFLASHEGLLATFLALYALVVPATFVQRLFFAFQRAGWAAVMQFAFAVTHLLSVWIASRLGAGLSTFVMIYVLTMLLVHAGFTVYGLKRFVPRPAAFPRFDRTKLVDLLQGSSLFFLLQLMVAAIFNSDQIILSAFFTSSEVAVYATTFKLFGVVIMLNGVILGPLWPAISDAIARSDSAWVKRAFYLNLQRSLVFSLASAVVLFLVGNTFLSIWTQGQLQAPYSLLLIMGLWVILDAYGQAMAMLLNAMKVVRMQVLIALTLLICGTALKLWLAGRLPIYGALMGTVIAFALIVAIPETIYIRNLFKTRFK